MHSTRLLALLIGFLLSGCGQQAPPSGGDTGEEHSGKTSVGYRNLGEDLQQLKDDFNANQGRVRLLFLNGPTCGICLRGMADLNDAFIAAAQNDDRLVTFVVHVPTLGAKEEHVAGTIPLLDGPRVHHYWEDSGIIGNHYKEVMGVKMYVWDFWMIYGPDVRWDATLPPAPDYYEHQLGSFSDTADGFPRDKMLQASRFATETHKYVEELGSRQFADDQDYEISESELLADGTLIPVVAQPRNAAVSQHIRNRGGYSNLKRIGSIEQRGSLEAGGRKYQLLISSARPNSLQRRVSYGVSSTVSELTDDGQVILDHGAARGLPADLEAKLLSNYEFDGLFVEWPDKGHQVKMIGMMKIAEVLAWRLELVQKTGQRWHLFVDSHGGGIVQASMLDEAGKPEYIVRQSDFRETAGFQFPHRIEYFDASDRLLAVEEIDDITVDVGPYDIQSEAVAH